MLGAAHTENTEAANFPTKDLKIKDIISKIYTVQSEQWCSQILRMSDSL